MKTKIGLLLLLLIALVVSAAIYMYNKPAATTLSEEAAYTLPAAKLFSEYEQDEQAANEKYLNKVLAVKGRIASITPAENNTHTVTLEAGSDMFGVSCELSADEVKKNPLKVGDSITIKGLCTGMLMDVVLVKCSVE